MIQRVIRTTAIIAVGISGCFSQTALPPSLNRMPILVELFTSEGCSSCPPADRFLAALDGQPIPGTELIVLSEHVDYWDRLGWKDPFSSQEISERQAMYARQLHIPDVYTPQMVVDGRRQFSGGNIPAGEQAIHEAMLDPRVSLQLSTVSIEGSRVRVHLESPSLDAKIGPRSLDVFVAIALNRAESQVERGENAKHRLTHVAVVRKLVRVGKLKVGQSLSRDIEVKIGPEANSQDLRVVIFLQDSNSGKIFGAAMKAGASRQAVNLHE